MFKQNCAVFLEGTKRYGRANVRVEGDTLTISQVSDGVVLETFEMREVASSTGTRVWAWDVNDVIKGTPNALRLVAVTGCGCGGIPPYPLDEGYSGAQ
jgi:hypothetical protein